MSQQEDIETLRGVYDEWARGEFGNVAVFDPEIEFVFGVGVPERGTYTGIEAMRNAFRGWLESWRDLRFELEELIPAGDRIVAAYHETGIGRSSGIRTELHGCHIWTMRNGKVVRLEIHASRAAALEAAGLSE